MLIRSLVVAGALVAGQAVGLAPASAQAWPSKTIRVVIPFGAGSATDVIPRLLFDPMAAALGQSIVVENRGGAGSTIGAGLVAKADADGYTLLATSSAHTITPSLFKNLAYSPAGDFAGVGVIGSVSNVLIIAPSKGIKTLAEFVAAAKAKPGSFTFASVGIGSAVHLSAERFRLAAGYEATHIPFKGGAEALTEVIAGRVDYYFCPIATALPFIRDGKLVPLAVSSPQRASALPDVPTTVELGFAESDYTLWIGLLAPAKTPKPIVERLNREMQHALADPALRAKLATLGVEPMPLTPAAFDARMAAEIEAYGKFATTAGLKPN